MRFVAYEEQGLQRVGIHTEQGVVPISLGLEDLVHYDAQRLAGIPMGQEPLLEENLTFSPCVPRERKIVCVGLNYRKHAEESGMATPRYPVLFSKFNNALAAYGDSVELSPLAEQYDYEAELAVVMGKRAKGIPREQALNYVFGYCCANDLSARDLQMRTGQWLLGKTLDGFCPLGPYLVTADEVGNPNELGIRCYVNGDMRQNSNTRDMIFPVDEIVSYVSSFMTLEPGDVILTGTPEGVILGYPEEQRVWLKPGDEIRVEIDRVGVLTNRLVGGV